MKKYDVIVIGGGHAGVEAATSSARRGAKTLLLTMRESDIGAMSCNPSIGGSAKGIVVREIDALGGLMGKVADKSHFQLKMLNSSKGPAVRCLRAQADKVTYPKNMLKELKNTQNLTIQEGKVEDLIVENNIVKGVILEDGTKIDNLSHIAHNCFLGENTALAFPCFLGGSSRIETNGYIAGGIIRNQCTVHENGFVGMGAVVTKDVPANTIVIGNPAKEYVKKSK